MRFRTVVPVLVSLTVMGCRAKSPPNVVTVVDSAGLEIVRNPEARGSTVWAEASSKSLTLGQAAGDPRVTFDLIRAASRLADGTLVVADGGSNQIRLFGADGSFRRAFG